MLTDRAYTGPLHERAIIVSRHPAAVEFIRHTLSSDPWWMRWSTRYDHPDRPTVVSAIPVVETATVETVRGRTVFGNIPLRLAAHAVMVVAVEFDGPAPRGAEYTVEDMRAAFATLRRYQVAAHDEPDSEED
jgi:hypothetical protein